MNLSGWLYKRLISTRITTRYETPDNLSGQIQFVRVIFFMRKEEEEKGGYGLRREPVIQEAITWHPRNYDLAHKNLCFPTHKTMT